MIKFIIYDSLESMIHSIAGPVEITCKDGYEYEVKGVPENKVPAIKAKIKAFVITQGKEYHEID